VKNARSVRTFPSALVRSGAPTMLQMQGIGSLLADLLDATANAMIVHVLRGVRTAQALLNATGPPVQSVILVTFVRENKGFS